VNSTLVLIANLVFLALPSQAANKAPCVLQSLEDALVIKSEASTQTFSPMSLSEFMKRDGVDRGGVFFSQSQYLQAVKQLKKRPPTQIDIFNSFYWASRAGLDVRSRFSLKSSSKNLESFDARILEIKYPEDEILGHARVRFESLNGSERSIELNQIEPSSVQIRHESFPTQPEVVRSKASEVAKVVGIKSLSHYTRDLNTLFQILSSGHLRAATSTGERFSGGRPANYLTIMREDMDLHLRPEPHRKGEYHPTLEFNLSLLDRDDFYINPGRDYGKNSSFSMHAGSTDLRRFLYLFGTNKKLFADIPEVVMQNPIDLQSLKTIWVPKGTKKQLLETLQQNQIRPPLNREWANLIRETGYTPGAE
jgi:hypothetical protein